MIPTLIMLVLCIMYTYITSALPACKDKDQNISPSVTSAQPTIVPEIITAQDTSVTNKKKTNIEIKTDLDIKAEEEIPKNRIEEQNFVKTLRQNNSTLFSNELDHFYYSDDMAEDYDLNEVELSDSDQTESNFLTEPTSPVKTNKKVSMFLTKESTPKTNTCKSLRSVIVSTY